MPGLQLVHCHGIVAGISTWAMHRTFHNEHYIATIAFSLLLSKSAIGILCVYAPTDERKNADEILSYAAQMFTVPLINAQFFYPEYKVLSALHILSAVIPTCVYGTSGVTGAGIKYVDLVTMANIFSMMKFSEIMNFSEGIFLGSLCILQFFALGMVSRLTNIQWLYLYTLGFCLIDITTVRSIEILHPVLQSGIRPLEALEMAITKQVNVDVTHIVEAKTDTASDKPINLIAVDNVVNNAADKAEKIDVLINDVESGNKAVETGNKAVGSGNKAVGSGNNAVETGNNAVETGNKAVGSGNKAVETGNKAVGRGNKAIASGNNAIETGNNALGSGNKAVGSGNKAVGSGNNAIGSGNKAVESGNNAVETGNNAVGSGNNSVGSGNNAVETGNKAVETGNKAVEIVNNAVKSVSKS